MTCGGRCFGLGSGSIERHETWPFKEWNPEKDSGHRQCDLQGDLGYQTLIDFSSQMTQGGDWPFSTMYPDLIDCLTWSKGVRPADCGLSL